MQLKPKDVESLEKAMLDFSAKLRELGATDTMIFVGFETFGGGRTYSASRDGNSYTIAGMLGRWLSDFNSGVLDAYEDADECDETGESGILPDDDQGDLFDEDGNLK